MTARTTAEATLADLIPSFALSLRAQNKSASTVSNYTRGAQQLVEFLRDNAMPASPATIGREHIEAFIGSVLASWKPATAATRYRDLQQLFRWLVEEGEITESPMRNMRPPHLPEQPVPVVSEGELRRLLAVCNGKSFEDRRDTAIILLFVDTGMRRAELANLVIEDVDLMEGLAVVLGKGGRPRACPFGSKVARALDRYLRLRRFHPSTGCATHGRTVGLLPVERRETWSASPVGGRGRW